MNEILIEYLDLGDGRYIENDIVKSKVTESTDDYLTWDQLWTGVKNDVKKIEKYLNSKKKEVK